LGNKLLSSFPQAAGFCVNYNWHPGNRILGDVTECLAGDDHIIERLASSAPNAPERLKNGIDFRLSPTSFFQVNREQAIKLLDTVAHAVGDANLVVDAYAGVGTIAMWLS